MLDVEKIVIRRLEGGFGHRFIVQFHGPDSKVIVSKAFTLPPGSDCTFCLDKPYEPIDPIATSPAREDHSEEKV